MSVGVTPGAARPGPLCRRVADLCRDIRFHEPNLNDQLASLSAALKDPLRVAFAGRVSMGKSTLVNALLHAPVAPTGDGETTRILTRFGAGEYEHVTLRLRDDSTRQVFLTPTGVLPPTYQVPVELIQEIRVRLPYSSILQRITILDTPGLDSANEAASSRTTESLFSRDTRAAVAEADALVYLLRTDSENDAAAIAAFNELTSADFCALNTIGVLNCKTEHSLADYRRIADRLKSTPAFRNRVIDIIPVMGLLAFAARTAMLTDRDAANLQKLASSDEGSLLIDVDEFLEAPSEVTFEDRKRLLELLGFNGLRIAMHTARSTSPALAEINAALLEQSGLPRLLEVLDSTFTNCADQIKAGQTLAALTRLSYQTDADTGRRTRLLIETLRADPHMHGIQELWALQQCTRADLDLPEWLPIELERVAIQVTPSAKLGLPQNATVDQILDAAQEAARRAHLFAAQYGLTRPEAHIAEILRRSYTNIFRTALALGDRRPAEHSKSSPDSSG